MATINYNNNNILLNGQPYPINSIRPVYAAYKGSNTVSLLFPWWSPGGNILWSGDVTTSLVNVRTGRPFINLAEFKLFCNAHFYN